MNELNFKQELTAAFGQPISENPTQAMVEAAYRHHGLDWRYLTIEVGPNGLEDAVKGAKAMGFQGFNCTIPHKVKVIEYLDGLGESASLMGAVNCVVRKDGQWIGENTDGKGFVSSLRELTDPKGKKALIFGAGGAARAISVEMALPEHPPFFWSTVPRTGARNSLNCSTKNYPAPPSFFYGTEQWSFPRTWTW